MKKLLSLLMLLAAIGLTTTACDQDGPYEEAGERIEENTGAEGFEDAGEELDEAMEETSEELEDNYDG